MGKKVLDMMKEHMKKHTKRLMKKKAILKKLMQKKDMQKKDAEEAYDEGYAEEGYAEEGYYEEGGELWATALYDYQGENEDDLSFYAGDSIAVLDQSDPSGWWKGSCN